MEKTAEAIIEIASSQLGVKESPAGSNKVKYNTAYYGREVSGSAYPWCCVFVWWVFKRADVSELFYGGQKTASCTALYNYYHKHGQAVPIKQARPGDLVFFIFDGGKSGCMNHIGVCESCEGGFVTTIDGNTGTNNEANGGAVMRRRRALKYVGGVVRPNYEEEKALTEQEVRSIVRDEMASIEAERAVQVVPNWGKDWWEIAEKSGLMDGTRPMDFATRLELAAVVQRAKK